MRRTLTLPLPYPDENCYSVLCRFAEKRGWQSTHQVCLELFGHNQPLAGYVYKPFRKQDFDRWQEGIKLPYRYGAVHSCYPYFSVFLAYTDACLLRSCADGSILTAGQEKRISRKCGFAKIRKKHFWYCPECAISDFAIYGETYWRRLPQMPGVSYCPAHKVRLKESGVSFEDANYRFIPANYAMEHIREPETDVSGNVFETEFLRIAEDTQWLLNHGFDLPDGDTVLARVYADSEGRAGPVPIYVHSETTDKEKREFSHYLAIRVMKETGRQSIDEAIQMYLGRILMIEKGYGDMENFFAS